MLLATSGPCSGAAGYEGVGPSSILMGNGCLPAGPQDWTSTAPPQLIPSHLKEPSDDPLRTHSCFARPEHGGVEGAAKYDWMTESTEESGIAVGDLDLNGVPDVVFVRKPMPPSKRAP